MLLLSICEGYLVYDRAGERMVSEVAERPCFWGTKSDQVRVAGSMFV